jgi:hypothetical protein
MHRGGAQWPPDSDEARLLGAPQVVQLKKK